MKIDILSDLHLDFWTKQNTTLSTKLLSTLDQLLTISNEVEVLIVAGDISHNPAQLNILEEIAKVYHYKKIFCVLGNHDLYLVDYDQRKEFQDSLTKQRHYYDFKSEIVTILNGDIVEYDGVTFGGAMGWYDASYQIKENALFSDPVHIWKETMNDAHYILGYKDFYEIYEQEDPKVQKILDADIVITHVCPLAHNIAFQEIYHGQESNMFFAFDGERYLEKTSAKYWVYGHSHGHHNFEVYDTKCVMNTLGYPAEMGRQKMTIEVVKKIVLVE